MVVAVCVSPIPEEGARIEEWQAYLTKLVDSFDKVGHKQTDTPAACRRASGPGRDGLAGH